MDIFLQRMEACPTLATEMIVSSLYVCVSVLHGETQRVSENVHVVCVVLLRRPEGESAVSG